jgi:hypothetical protein
MSVIAPIQKRVLFIVSLAAVVAAFVAGVIYGRHASRAVEMNALEGTRLAVLKEQGVKATPDPAVQQAAKAHARAADNARSIGLGLVGLSALSCIGSALRREPAPRKLLMVLIACSLALNTLMV